MKRTFTRQRITRAAMTLLVTMLTATTAWASTFSGGDGSQGSPYQIASTADLNQLATNVNSGTSYEGVYFKVTANITYTSSDAWNLASSTENNFTAIGNWSKPFKGIFDGNHQTISGIRIYKGGTDATGDGFLGLFGCISGSAVVKDVTLKNTRITGIACVAGIVGAIPEDKTASVSGCIVGDDVAIHTKEFHSSTIYDYSHGGIVGLLGSGSVSGCFSAATLTVDEKVITANKYNSHGAIVGNGNGTLSNNYYCGSVNGVFTGVGKGTSGSTATSDVTENDGALPVHTFTLTNTTTTSATTNAAKVLTVDGKDFYRDGTTVTITVTPPSGSLLNSLTVTDGSSNTVAAGYWYTGNTITFTLPASNVTVSDPTFTNGLTSLYINMPKTGTVNATIPAGVTSFKVYDDGGADGNYSDNCDGTLVLTAPTGYVLQLSGSITTETTHDYLTVYDGSAMTDNKLLNAVSGTTAITTVTTTGENMTLSFHSDGMTNYAGLDLTVTLISTSTDYAINGLGDTTGGRVDASIGGNAATTAHVHDVVTLTASPLTGYVLNSLSVVDANSNAVDIDWSIWSNTATFKMPPSAVTVTPTFTNDLTSLYINMPATGTKTVAIPATVQSFKVYDDGGSDGNYSNYCSGTLTLTAPLGYALRLSGNITTEKDRDKLTVYDNNEPSGTKLLDGVSSTSNNTQTDITTVTTTGESMTLYFESDVSVSYAGLDLTVTIIKTLELANDADNSTTISEKNGQTIGKLTLTDRTLLRDGNWNTLCLPFALSAEQIATSPLAGFIIKKLNGSTSNLDGEGKLTLNFTEATAIEAGKPYIVKWNTAVANTSTPLFNPADDVVTALNFISEVPTYDNGLTVVSGEGPGKLVDGNTGTKYFTNQNPWVEFHYANAITPKGYALWTANDEMGKRNPKSWTIKAKVNSDDDWTDLVTVDNSAGDKLPMANDQRTVFALDNSAAYKYFRFEAVLNATTSAFQLAELQFCTVQPTIIPANITNPVFNSVTIDNSAEAQAKMTVTSTDGKVKFVGTYSPFATTDGLLLDAHNTANGAFHAALGAIREGYAVDSWYTDANKTIETTSIPLDADGSATLYVKWLKTVSYIDENGDPQSHTATEIDGSQTNLPGGWYVVNSDVALTTKLNFTGDTHLILADGKTLSIDASGDSDPNYFYLGLSCRDGSTSYELTIYGQAAGTGKVTSKHGHPGYGSACGYNAKTITINGGVVEATSSGRGICGSNVIINGGQIILAPSYANITADNITLGWRKPSDYIQSYGFINPSGVGTITITDGKVFTDGTGIYDHTTTTGTLEKLTNKTLHPCLVLTDNADNTDALAEYNGKTIAVALNGRTLYKDGAWNTLYLPFDVDITNSPLAGDPGNNPEAKTLNSGTSGLNGSTLTLNFDDATTIPAGKPFLMKWSNTAETITNPVFIGVTINKNASTEISFSGGKFVGSYSPVDFTADDRSILFLGAANQLHWPNADMTLGACRAHFELSDGNKVSEILLNFDGEETTSLREKGIVNSEKFAAAAEWYTLDGRRLSQKPTQKGLYIHNGRKEVLK